MLVDVNNRNDPAVVSFVSTIIAQAEQGECDVIASGSVAGEQRGYLYDPATDQLETDSLLDGPFTVSQLGEQLVVGDVLLVMGAPPGAGRRLALDRDRDGWLNRSEGYFETDPADPNSNWWQW
jgi:hypothetical protein